MDDGRIPPVVVFRGIQGTATARFVPKPVSPALVAARRSRIPAFKKSRCFRKHVRAGMLQLRFAMQHNGMVS